MTTALERGEGSASRPRRSLPPGKDPTSIVQGLGWAPGPVWTGAENLASTGIRSPDRPARSQSLYRLSYPAHPAGKLYFFYLQIWVMMLCNKPYRSEYGHFLKQTHEQFPTTRQKHYRTDLGQLTNEETPRPRSRTFHATLP